MFLQRTKRSSATYMFIPSLVHLTSPKILMNRRCESHLGEMTHLQYKHVNYCRRIKCKMNSLYFVMFGVIFIVGVSCSPVLVQDVAIPAEHEIIPVVSEVQNPARIQRSPGPIFDLLGLKSHHHHHGGGGYYGGHHGGGGYHHGGGGYHHGGGGYHQGGGGGGFAGSSAQAGSFAGNGGGFGGNGFSNSQASSNAASFQAGPFSASFSSSQANSGSNSFGGYGGFYRRK